MKTKLLYISLDFNYTCGVSKHVFINLKYLSKNPDYELYFITNKGDSIDRLNEIPDVRVSFFNFEKDHKNIFRIIIDSFKLYTFCKKNKIDIIHTHHRYPELISVLVSKVTGARTITTVHSLVAGLKVLSFRSNKIICVSNSVKKNLLENYPHSKYRITLLYNCIEDSFFDTVSNRQMMRDKFGFNLDYKIILFVGRMSRIKGVDTLINTFVKINRHNKNLKLILLGQVEDINILEAIKGFEKQIFVFPPDRDVYKFYSASDLVVLPSRIDSFPYVMLEAGAMKKPFIGGNTGGISEFIDDGVNGHLFEPSNKNELSEKILYVLNNPDEANRMALALNQKVKRENNCSKYFENLEQIYKSLV